MHVKNSGHSAYAWSWGAAYFKVEAAKGVFDQAELVGRGNAGLLDPHEIHLRGVHEFGHIPNPTGVRLILGFGQVTIGVKGRECCFRGNG